MIWRHKEDFVLALLQQVSMNEQKIIVHKCLIIPACKMKVLVHTEKRVVSISEAITINI